MTTSPDGRLVYVTSEEDNQVSVIDTAANQVIKRFRVGPRPRDSAFLRAYVTSENGASISVVDTKSHTVIETIKLTGETFGRWGRLSRPMVSACYVSTGRGGTLGAIDTKTNKLVGSVAVGTRPWELALSPDGARLYTANGPSNNVSVVDTGTLTVLTKAPVGQSPWGVAIVPRQPETGQQSTANAANDIRDCSVRARHMRPWSAFSSLLGDSTSALALLSPVRR